MQARVFAVLMLFSASRALAQTPAAGEAALATPTGHEVHVDVGHYNYIEPGTLNISIHGARFAGGYTGTLSLDRNRHVFAQSDLRGSIGAVRYDGWCSPFFVTPDTTSPNGYALDLGAASRCSDSVLGGGDVPATGAAPAFTIEGLSDVSFVQHAGWAVRASVKYQLTRRLSVEPSYIHWHVSASPVSVETVTFTVNGVTAQEQFGAYEPVNKTHEFTVRFGFRF